jgi:hypothetical protein
VAWHQPFDGFDFHDYLVLNQKVEAKAAVERQPVIAHRHFELPPERQARLRELTTKTLS